MKRGREPTSPTHDRAVVRKRPRGSDAGSRGSAQPLLPKEPEEPEETEERDEEEEATKSTEDMERTGGTQNEDGVEALEDSEESESEDEKAEEDKDISVNYEPDNKSEDEDADQALTAPLMVAIANKAAADAANDQPAVPMPVKCEPQPQNSQKTDSGAFTGPSSGSSSDEEESVSSAVPEKKNAPMAQPVKSIMSPKKNMKPMNMSPRVSSTVIMRHGQMTVLGGGVASGPTFTEYHFGHGPPDGSTFSLAPRTIGFHMTLSRGFPVELQLVI